MGWSVSANVDEHQSLKSEADSDRQPVEEPVQWSNVEELGEIENKSCSCILIQLQTNSTQKNTFHEQPAVAQSQVDKRLSKHPCQVAWIEMARCS